MDSMDGDSRGNPSTFGPQSKSPEKLYAVGGRNAYNKGTYLLDKMYSQCETEFVGKGIMRTLDMMKCIKNGQRNAITVT